MANAFLNAQRQLAIASKILHLSPKQLNPLKKPERILRAMIPVKMDSGKIKKFLAYRVQYNSARGPYKGGIRFHPHVDIHEVKALSFWMAIKCATVNIPLGGGKGGVVVDPHTLSQSELERLSRGYIRAFYKYLGPKKDVPAPDVYTNSQIMDWMVDEFSKLTGRKQPAMITGKSIAAGGSLGRDTATADGGFYILQALSKKLKLLPKKTTVIVQGFGNAGGTFARLVDQAGYKLIGTSDSKKGIYDPTNTGFSYTNIEMMKKKTGSVGSSKKHRILTNQQLLTQPCDVLVLAALENQITKTNARKIKAKVVIELANGPVTPEADVMLYDKHIIVVPDVLANAGGVTVSYFEWLQNLSNKHWSRAHVTQKLKPIMIKAFTDIWTLAKDQHTDMRTAAFILAVVRIVNAKK